MSDEALALILDGGVEQQKVINVLAEERSDNNQSFLQSIVVSNADFGPKSLHKVLELEKNLIELKLNNIKESATFGLPVMRTLINEMIYRSQCLMKLTFSKIDLNDDELIWNLGYMLQTKKYLQYIDLSCTCLTPKQLEFMSAELRHLAEQLRELNLSYNRLVFDETASPEDAACSASFVVNVAEWVQNAKMLSHLNLSGMDIPKAHMIPLCNAMTLAPLLSAVHLNDNGISAGQDVSYLAEVLEAFGMTEKDVPVLSRRNADFAERPDAAHLRKDGELKGHKAFDYAKAIKKYMAIRLSEEEKTVDITKYTLTNRAGQEKLLQDLNKKRQQVKDYVLLGKEHKKIEQRKCLHSSKGAGGVGREGSSCLDYFVVTRVLNHPELTFNQRPQHDKDTNIRFFEKDAMQFWQMSARNECYICQRHMYTQIFYQRGILAQNKGLTEVTDPAIVEELTYQYKKDYLSYRTNTPLICGTVVKREHGHGVFDRKLKMLRASVYSLLSVCQTSEFSQSDDVTQQVKEGV